jgi:hypothetical protein
MGIFNPRCQTVHGNQFFTYLPGNIGQIRKRCHHPNLLRERETRLEPKQAQYDEQKFPPQVSQ